MSCHMAAVAAESFDTATTQQCCQPFPSFIDILLISFLNSSTLSLVPDGSQDGAKYSFFFFFIYIWYFFSLSLFTRGGGVAAGSGAGKRNRLLNAVRGEHFDFIRPSNPKNKRRRESLRRDVVDGGRDLALETRHERRPHAVEKKSIYIFIYFLSFFFPFSLKFD